MRLLKLLFRLLASLASAILVVSGYLFFLSISAKSREMPDDESSDEKNDDPSETENG
ncbi:MAG: hypothetical protein GY866_43350 [Proteobacteria bacterium]|nr:hypothetical protein [Pseudomonadota bacterium]